MIFNPYNNEHEAQLFTNAETYAKSTLFLNIYNVQVYISETFLNSTLV